MNSQAANVHDDEADERAFDEFLGLAERGEAPPVGAFLEERGLAGDAELRDRLETFFAASKATRKGGLTGSVGPYRILESIGSGGFGLVYLAQQSVPVKRQVALKVLRAGMDSQEVLDRFEAEKSALSRMDHPGIAHVLDAGTTDDGRPYFAMEYVPGEAITRFADAARLVIDERLRLFALVCDAVQHAHQKGVLHRDLKPSNVLVRRVDGKPRPKVIDFGVAKALDFDAGLGDSGDGEGEPRTRAGALVGTLEYMAPEQANGALVDGTVDSRADIYSLGVLLYELLAGTLPIDPRSSAHASGTDVVRALLEADPPALGARVTSEAAAARGESTASLRKKLRGELDWLVQRSLAKDPDERYASASELALDARRYLDDEPVLARPQGLVYRVRKLAARHRGAAIGAGVAGLATVLGAAGIFMALVEARSERDRARDAEGLARERLVHVEEAKASAEASAAESAAVTGFLRSMWSFARPTGATSGTIAAVELLDRASDSLDAAMEGKEALRVTLRSTLGEINLDLERLREAEEEMRSALRIGLDQVSLGTLERATLEHNLAAVLAEQGQWKEAKALAVSSAEARVAHRETPPEDMARSRDLVARCLSAEGNGAEAVTMQREAWEGAVQVFGRRSLETMSFTSNLATYLRELGSLEEATFLMEEVCEVRREELGEAHPDTLSAHSNLAMLFHSRGDHRRAAETFRRVLDGHERVWGPKHLATARSCNNVATQYLLLGDGERALPLLKRAVAIFRVELSAGHPTRISVTVNLSKVLLDLGRLDEALETSTGAVAAADEALPDGHTLRGSARTIVGEALVGLGRGDEAQPVLEEALPILISARGESHPTTIRSMETLASILETGGDAAGAAKWRERAARASSDS